MDYTEPRPSPATPTRYLDQGPIRDERLCLREILQDPAPPVLLVRVSLTGTIVHPLTLTLTLPIRSATGERMLKGHFDGFV